MKLRLAGIKADLPISAMPGTNLVVSRGTRPVGVRHRANYAENRAVENGQPS